MPERSKKRKNNKNKRKNKNNSRQETNRQDVNAVTEVSSDLQEHNIDQLDEQNKNVLITINDSHTIENSATNNKNELPESHIIAAKASDDNRTKLINDTEEDYNNIIYGKELSVYIVETPEQSSKAKPKLSPNTKSKSLDNDDEPKITEITDDTDLRSDDDNYFSLIDSGNVLISDVESDIEWEIADNLLETNTPQSNEFAIGTLSIQSIPLNVAKCEHNTVLTPEEELSLRQYLQTLDLATHPTTVELQCEIEKTVNCEVKHRLRKKGLASDFLVPRHRYLDVIDEEGSGDSTLVSQRQSYVYEKLDDFNDLEDDVFLPTSKDKNNDAYYKKGNTKGEIKNIRKIIPQECILLGTKMMEPNVSEARGDWTVETVEKMTGAEVVYLTDSSSSASDIYDIGEETDDGIETDTSVRIITPTIEVTDTHDLLRNQFLSENIHQNTNNLSNEKPIEESNEINLTKSISADNNLNNHEIEVLSTENINPSLYVLATTEKEKNKDLNAIISDSSVDSSNKELTPNEETSLEILKEDAKRISEESNINTGKCMAIIENIPKLNPNNLDIEIKVLKCELNDAFNNLIKEVSDSESGNENQRDDFTRQDSSSSVCSSQCTAKYNPTHTSLNDITNNMHDDTLDLSKTDQVNISEDVLKSHVKEVFECVTGTSNNSLQNQIHHQPLALRDICVERIAKFPYGEKILEELASVSERLQNITVVRALKTTSEISDSNKNKMSYYPLPDVSSIEKVSLPTKGEIPAMIKNPTPPPIKPRNSSLKKSQDDSHWTGLPTKSEPVYVCLSPSQKMLMERTNTIITKDDASELVDMHKKFVDRRGYNEYYSNEKGETRRDKEAPLAIPFKSQTGSRLLAIIRDPEITNNITSNESKSEYVEQRQWISDKNTSKINNKNFNISQDVKNNNLFKPIPPPRLKKYSSSFYESDESSDFTDSSLRSMHSERKLFHYSTGNLNKEIEKDVSCIQNMHRQFINSRQNFSISETPRRPSLPKDLCEQQMEYIRKKEKEVEAELQRLEAKKLTIHNTSRQIKAPLMSNKELRDKLFDVNDFHFSNRNYDNKSASYDKLNETRSSSHFKTSQEEIKRDQMYSEYVSKMAERQERREQKIIKIRTCPSYKSTISKSMPTLDIMDSRYNNRIEEEFISKAKERRNKFGIKDPETEDEKEEKIKDIYREPKVIEHKIKVIENKEEKNVQELPRHIQEFVGFTAKNKERKSSSPGESSSGPTSPHVLVLCAVVVLMFTVGQYFLSMLRQNK